MISLYRFYRAIQRFTYLPDRQQRAAIRQPRDAPLFIVAGPGTGKTTCLTFRILKLIFVDGVPPRGILATTFTNKAAAELRSRVLRDGINLQEALDRDPALPPAQRDRVRALDINQVRTGTVDSLSEQILREYRPAGVQPPLLADEFVAKTLLLQNGLLQSGRYRNSDLDDWLADVHGSQWNFNISTKTNLIGEIRDRALHDQVDWDRFVTGGPPCELAGRTVLGEAVDSYVDALQTRMMVDFAGLEQALLDQLRLGRLQSFTDELEVVLVDEYQDTNLLQEELYFELADACGGALAVVGDDDQSLYRFRGATVELFSGFAQLYQRRFARPPATVFLSTNYRSTQAIITFVNNYAGLDSAYRTVRVQGKPLLAAPRRTAVRGEPVLAMFRPTLGQLARDVAAFITAVFRGPGVRLPSGTVLIRDPVQGDVGDCAVLCSSPADVSATGKPRLPLLLQQELAALGPQIRVFNPRGQRFADIFDVQVFGGLLLECLDPNAAVESNTSGLGPTARTALARWRQLSTTYLRQVDTPRDLTDYVESWARRDPRDPNLVWRPRVPALELVYGLRYYFPFLRDDPEGHVYLEVFARQLAACAQVGRFKARVAYDPADPDIGERSVRELLRLFLAPIASGTVGVNEELLEDFPRDRLSILSIHQSKGLEFPLVIVDVGSDYKDRRAARFKRYPNDGSTAHRLEDLMRPWSPFARMRMRPRSPIDRAFDDLYRQYFVAFSRPQDQLLLVGVDATAPGGRVENVATGWDRQGTCQWNGSEPFVRI